MNKEEKLASLENKFSEKFLNHICRSCGKSNPQYCSCDSKYDMEDDIEALFSNIKKLIK